MSPDDPTNPPSAPREPNGSGVDAVRALEALLDFHLGAGADGLLAEDPVDAFAASVRPAPPKGDAAGPAPIPSQPPTLRQDKATGHPPSGPLEPTHHAVLPDDAAVETARESARAAQSLEELRETLARFEGCNLRLTAKSLVFADGAPSARVMFIGEAPGREEDRQGVPFVGRSGQLLERMLAAVGLARSEVYITNVVPWRPPGNRTPSPQETEICKPFVLRQIELVAPDVVVFLGGASAKALTGTTDGILKLRGRWLELPIGGASVRAMATLHPAYLLRSPIQKRLAWRDFLAIKAALAENAAQSRN